jgi:hypothetical protein
MTDELLEFKLNFFEDEIKNLNKKVESIEKNLIQKIQNIENKIINLSYEPLQEKSKKWETIIDMILKSVIAFLLFRLGLPA